MDAQARAQDIVIQAPPAGSAAAPAQLMLLFHGVGATAASMQPLGERLAAVFPQAWIVAIAAPHPSDFGAGWQWFSVQGISEENRITRVAEAMPAFRASIQHWQAKVGLGVAPTCLLGFSQGAIMALESTQHGQTLAGRIVSLSGRMCQLPSQVPKATTVHMIHGKQDPVIHYGLTVQVAEHWIAQGADVTADVIPFLAHAVNDEVVETIIHHLTTTIPKRMWDEALRGAPAH